MNAFAPFSCDIAGLPRVADALRFLRSRSAPCPDSEPVAVHAALGRVLAEDAHACLTVPPCDRSAMDGYAFHFGASGPLRLSGAAPAGAPFAGPVSADCCVAISTGGALPQGCDTVAMQEHCHPAGDRMLVSAKHRGTHVRRRGEDFHAADCLVAAGTRLRARHIALLAAGGHSQILVRRRLRIAILSIGDELLAKTADAIADANRPMLLALCGAQGHCVSDLGILPDCRTEVAKALAGAARDHDAILLTAGTSQGESDYVRDALLDCGGQLLVSGVAIRPGKPVSFGRIGQTTVMALPGNPAAAYVTFLTLGLPLLRHLSAEFPAADPWQKIRAGFAYRKKPGLREYLRVCLMHDADGAPQCQPCRDNGPAMLRSLTEAQGLIMLGEDDTGFAPGDAVSFASFDALELA
jgi:molybdopterin molybdotransferase